MLLWKHFRVDEPRELARRTVDLYRRHQLAAAKLMPDIPLLFPDLSLSSFDQIAQLRRLGPAPLLGRVADYLRAVELTRDLLTPEDPLLVTLFAPLGLIGLWAGSAGVRGLAAAPRTVAHEVLWALGGFVNEVAEACVSAGADGIYYSCWGQDTLSKEEYLELGVPYDLAGLRGAAGAEFRLLHVHGALNHDVGRYASYPVQVVGWSESESLTDLVQGAAQLPSKLVMGGIPETLGEGALEASRTRVAELRRELGAAFVLAPGCSLPDATSDEELGRLRQLTESF